MGLERDDERQADDRAVHDPPDVRGLEMADEGEPQAPHRGGIIAPRPGARGLTRPERRVYLALQRSAGRSTSTQLAPASARAGTSTRGSAAQKVSGMRSWTWSAYSTGMCQR